MNKGSLIHSFHKLTFYVPGTVIGARYTQIKSSPVLKGLPTISWRGRAKVCHRAMPKGLCTNYLMPQWCWVTTNHITLVSYSNNCSFLTRRGGCLDSPADFGWGPWHAWRLPAVGWSRTASPWWHNSASRVSHPHGSGWDTRGRAHLTAWVIFMPLLKNVPWSKQVAWLRPESDLWHRAWIQRQENWGGHGDLSRALNKQTWGT